MSLTVRDALAQRAQHSGGGRFVKTNAATHSTFSYALAPILHRNLRPDACKPSLCRQATSTGSSLHQGAPSRLPRHPRGMAMPQRRDDTPADAPATPPAQGSRAPRSWSLPAEVQAASAGSASTSQLQLEMLQERRTQKELCFLDVFDGTAVTVAAAKAVGAGALAVPPMQAPALPTCRQAAAGKSWCTGKSTAPLARCRQPGRRWPAPNAMCEGVAQPPVPTLNMPCLMNPLLCSRAP